MEIMLSHLGVGMAYDALDPFQKVFNVDGAYDGQGAMIKSLFEHGDFEMRTRNRHHPQTKDRPARLLLIMIKLFLA